MSQWMSAVAGSVKCSLFLGTVRWEQSVARKQTGFGCCSKHFGGLKRCSHPVTQLLHSLFESPTAFHFTSPPRWTPTKRIGITSQLTCSLPDTVQVYFRVSVQPWTATDLWLHPQMSRLKMLHECSTRPFTFYSLNNLLSHCSYSYSYNLTYCRDFLFSHPLWGFEAKTHNPIKFHFSIWYLDLMVDVIVNYELVIIKPLLLTLNRQLLQPVSTPVFNILIWPFLNLCFFFRKLPQY